MDWIQCRYSRRCQVVAVAAPRACTLVARAFARERATVFLAGRTPAKLDQVAFAGRDEIVQSLEDAAQLNRLATLDDVGNVAAFVAPDLARTITASDINISCGAIVD